MAQGTLTIFEELTIAVGKKYHDFTADTFSVILVSETIVGMIATATPDRTDFTEVANGDDRGISIEPG